MDDKSTYPDGVAVVTWVDGETGTRGSKAFARWEWAKVEAGWLLARGHLDVRVTRPRPESAADAA
jgi:hypothetical protein